MAKEKWASEEPQPGYRKRDWAAITARLRKKPGEWMLVEEQAQASIAGTIRLKKMTALRSDEWEYEVRARNTSPDNRRADIWMSAKRKDKA